MINNILNKEFNVVEQLIIQKLNEKRVEKLLERKKNLAKRIVKTQDQQKEPTARIEEDKRPKQISTREAHVLLTSNGYPRDDSRSKSAKHIIYKNENHPNPLRRTFSLPGQSKQQSLDLTNDIYSAIDELQEE